jgi:hypothetical protein
VVSAPCYVVSFCVVVVIVVVVVVVRNVTATLRQILNHIYVFRVIIRINSDHTEQHSPFAVCNGGTVCFV